MQTLEICCAYRKEYGKGPSRRLRAAGQIPAVLYRKGTALSLQFSGREVHRMFQATSKEKALLTLHISDGEATVEKAPPRLAILKEVQRDPVYGNILHLDFFEVAMHESILLSIPVSLVGVAVGVKNSGILQQGLREIELRCLPEIIPNKIEVDVSSLAIGDSIHVRDISLPEGIKIVTDLDRVVVSVVPPLSEAKMEAILTGGTREVKEPEVIGETEKKEEGKTKGQEKEAAKK